MKDSSSCKDHLDSKVSVGKDGSVHVVTCVNRKGKNGNGSSNSSSVVISTGDVSNSTIVGVMDND